MVVTLIVGTVSVSAQVDKRDVRRGNRDYKKANYREAEIDYRKAIIKDSLSMAANYNLAADLYRQQNPQEAQKVLDRIKTAGNIYCHYFISSSAQVCRCLAHSNRVHICHKIKTLISLRAAAPILDRA